MNTLYNIIYRRLRGKTRLKRISAVVVEAVENSNNTKFKVTYANSKNDEICIQLINKSKDSLSEGDHVWIYYWNSVTDGYIALKNGLSSFGTDSGGGETIIPPIETETNVINSYKFSKSNVINSNSYSYSISEQTTQSERVSFSLSGTFVLDRFVYSPAIWETSTAARYHIVWYYNNITLLNNVVASVTNDPDEIVEEGVNRLFDIYDAARYNNLTLPFLKIDNNGQAVIKEYNYSIQLDISSSYYQIIETDSDSNTQVCYTYTHQNDGVAFILESSLRGLETHGEGYTKWFDVGLEGGAHGINGIDILIRPVHFKDGKWQRICSDPGHQYGHIEESTVSTYHSSSGYLALPRNTSNVPSKKCLVAQTITNI